MKSRFLFVLMIALISTLAISGSVSGHGKTTVGDYDLEIGFHNEPAVLGLPNGLDLFVTNSKTGEKVNGLADTLQAEVIFGSSKKSLKIEPVEDQDGAYYSFLIPGATGDYTFHVFGKINDTPVDVSMTSSPDTFNSVELQSVYTFPGADPKAADTQSAANQSTTTATYVGIGGLVAGLAGVIIGLVALQAARRQKS